MLCELPVLEYDYKDLAPYMSEEQVRTHYGEHHQAQVNGANEILQKLGKARKEKTVDLDLPSTLKNLSFNIGGHLLHSLFWSNIAPEGKSGTKPDGKLAAVLTTEFGSVERFKKEFTKAAISNEGPGWAALTYSRKTGRPTILQLEKHNTKVCPMHSILLVADVFDHAYQIDYKNDRAKFIDAFFHLVNWGTVNKRLENLIEQQGRKA
jgi:Fe-Mn family superoxide dismutase